MPDIIKKHQNSLKSLALMPKTNTYENAPLEEIDEDKYERMVDSLNTFN
jgi:hypothetical protein